MSEKITYGIKNLKYAKKTITEDGSVTFGTPVAIPGAYEISLPIVGDTAKVYADNITYVKIPSNQGYDGNFGCYGLPESFLTDVLGYTKDENSVLIEKASSEVSEFALLGEFSTDTVKTKRWVLYNCSAKRPEFGGQTKEETITAKQVSVPITATPLEGTDELIKATVTGDDSNSTWKNWFDKVYMPSESASV